MRGFSACAWAPEVESGGGEGQRREGGDAARPAHVCAGVCMRTHGRTHTHYTHKRTRTRMDAQREREMCCIWGGHAQRGLDTTTPRTHTHTHTRTRAHAHTHTHTHAHTQRAGQGHRARAPAPLLAMTHVVSRARAHVRVGSEEELHEVAQGFSEVRFVVCEHSVPCVHTVQCVHMHLHALGQLAPCITTHTGPPLLWIRRQGPVRGCRGSARWHAPVPGHSTGAVRG
jgi:hypothetical protein